MAKAKCEVKIEWKTWNRSGYAEVMDGPGVQGLLDQKASATVSAANGSFTPRIGEGTGYVAEDFQGTLAKGRVLKTATAHADASERKHNRLQAVYGGGQ